MLVELDLAPEVVQLLDYHRGQYSRSDFINYMIALYDQGVRQPVQQVQYQHPQQRLAQYDDSGYIEPLPPVQPARQPMKLRKDMSLNTILHGNTRSSHTVTRPKSKTVPRKTR